MQEKLLQRSSHNKMLCGVCGGIGEYLGVDPTVIRLAAVLALFISHGWAVLAYLVALGLMPAQR